MIKARRIGYKDPTIAAANVFYSMYRNTSKHRGISFKLSRKVFISLIDKPCHYCGIPPNNPLNPYLRKNGSRRRKSTTSTERARAATRYVNGLDRVNNNAGYCVQNVVSCCLECNGAKSNKTLKEFKTWVKRLVKFQTKRNSK